MGYSVAHVDKSCVFRQTFENGEYDVLNNPYNKGISTEVIYLNNTAVFNGTSSYIQYPIKNIKHRKPISIRIKGKVTSTLNRVLFDARNSNFVGCFFRFNAATNILAAASSNLGGTALTYLNGVLYNNEIFNNTYVDIVATFTIGAIYSILIAKDFNSASLFATVSLDLVEIYDRVLTASEIKLLYQDKLYKQSRATEASCVFDLDVADRIISDKSSYGRPLTIGGNISVVNSPAPCIKFPNSSAAYISTPDFIGTDDVYGYTWIKPRFRSGGLTMLWSSLLENGPFKFRFNDSNQRLYLYSDGTTFNFTVAATIPATTWYCVGFYRRRSGLFRVFVNGVSKMTAAATEYGSGVPLAATYVCSIGRSPDTGGNYYNGYMSKMKVFRGNVPGNIEDILANFYNSEKSYYGV